MKVIYVSGSYRGKDENEVFNNIIHARNVAVKLWHQGWACICPHTNTMFMGSMMGDKMFLEGDLEILSRCDAIFMLRGFHSSRGATEEYELAVRLNKDVYYEEEE